VTLGESQVSAEEQPQFVQRFPDQAAADEAASKILDRCAALPSKEIQMLYRAMNENPAGLTIAQMIRGCFDANGVTDGAGLSDDALIAKISDPSYVPSSASAESCKDDYVPPWDDRGNPG